MFNDYYNDALNRTSYKISEAWSNLEHAKERVVDYDDDICKKINDVQKSVHDLLDYILRKMEES